MKIKTEMDISTDSFHNLSFTQGSIEVICGSMFSGKTEELIRRIRRAGIARQKAVIFKPAVDTRYSDTEVVSHDARSVPSTVVSSSGSILLLSDNVDVVGIDEAQFLDGSLAEVCVTLANRGIRVIVAGLDMDFLGRPFGPIPSLCAVADSVTKVHAICMQCGRVAQFSHRTVENSKQILIGETEKYEPLCRLCYINATQKNKS